MTIYTDYLEMATTGINGQCLQQLLQTSFNVAQIPRDTAVLTHHWSSNDAVSSRVQMVSFRVPVTPASLFNYHSRQPDPSDLTLIHELYSVWYASYTSLVGQPYSNHHLEIGNPGEHPPLAWTFNIFHRPLGGQFLLLIHRSAVHKTSPQNTTNLLYSRFHSSS